MAEYNSKMNDQLYDVCALVSDDLRRKDVGLFFCSIHQTLDHLLYGDMAWLLRFLNRENEVPDLSQQLYKDFSKLSEARKKWDQKILDWSSLVNEKWLASDFLYTSKIDGKVRSKATWLLVAHMFNHEAHHRGQITTVLNQMGYDYGVTDLPFLIDV